ncbi:hypothetical protein SAMN04488692_10580 [Halarsenatibacter silvermanii]|uniref:Uncharacterized protein n=1 Tax=Halarsenatibacter silvermanii TaxID=321763 RepID=A0A1G9KQG6_9FIRM|nr:hypothetical protein SAMN04488692_10580 [Halarsenatibacter silvermanii]
MTGAGFGGSTVNLVRSEALENFRREVGLRKNLPANDRGQEDPYNMLTEAF